MEFRVRLLIIIIIASLIQSNFQANPNKFNSNHVLNIVKIDKPIDINGKLNNPIWSIAKPIELQYEISPGDNVPAKEKTIVKALYDETNIYFGVKCYDSNPEEIRANLTERDKIYSDDYIVLLIDTYGDSQRAYEVALNPFGIQGDFLVTLNAEDMSFDFNWSGAASINDSGWTAEISIPFNSLVFENRETQIWKFNAVRTMPRSSRTQISWSPIYKDIPGYISQAGIIKGLKNIKSTKTVEVLPYIIGQKNGSVNDSEDPSSEFNFQPFEARIGGGIKYSPNPNLSIDAVINPDFSQIESDAEQISVNTNFALFYEEKRPFFLIGRELLQTRMYYSRSINNPLVADRIIGKTGSLSYMYLGAYDRNTVFVIPGEEESSTVETNKKSLANIGKLRYDFGNDSYIGSLLMGRNLNESHNYLFGIDWSYKFWENWFFSGEGYLSQTKELKDTSLVESDRKFGDTGYTAELDGENYNGNGLNLILSHSQKHYSFYLHSDDFSPTYQTYNGLLNSSGIRKQFMKHTYVMYPDSSFIDRASASLTSVLKHNYDGIPKYLRITPSVYLTMKGQTFLYLSYQLIQNEKYNGEIYKNINRGIFSINTKPTKQLSFSLFVNYGRFIYRSDTPSMGIGHKINTSLILKLTPKFKITLGYNRARLSDEDSNELFYDGNIFRTVGIYQFSPEAFFRTIIQYNSFDDLFRLYPLFSYKLGAFSTFYVGTSSDYIDYRGDYGIKNTSQQYFIKLQYLVDI